MWWLTLSLAAPMDVDAWMAEVRPMVEEVAGRTFDPVPQAKVVDTNQLVQLLSDEQMGLAHLLYPNMDVTALIRTGRAAGWAAPRVGGKYGLFDQTVYVSEDALKGMRRRLKADGGLEVDEATLGKCVLAHELVHALHGQLGVFEATAQLRDEEALSAVNVLSEGHATWVEDVVCRRLTDAAVVDGMKRSLALDDETSNYGAGLRFVEAHQEHIWDVLAEPPRSTRLLLHPEAYGQPLPVMPSAEKVRRAATSLGSETVFVKRSSYLRLARMVGTDPSARVALAAMKEGVEATAGWRSGSITVARLDFGTPDAAAAFVLSARSPRARDVSLPVYTKAPEPLDVADGGFVAEQTMRDSRSGYPAQTMTRYLASKGQWVGMVTILQTSRKTDKVVEALEMVLVDTSQE